MLEILFTIVSPADSYVVYIYVQPLRQGIISLSQWFERWTLKPRGRFDNI